jgi:hypothetical protein
MATIAILLVTILSSFGPKTILVFRLGMRREPLCRFTP